MIYYCRPVGVRTDIRSVQAISNKSTEFHVMLWPHKYKWACWRFMHCGSVDVMSNQISFVYVWQNKSVRTRL